MDSCKCDNPDHHQYQAALGEWSITEEGWTPCVIYKSVCRYCMTMYINDKEWNLLEDDEAEMKWHNQLI